VREVEDRLKSGHYKNITPAEVMAALDSRTGGTKIEYDLSKGAPKFLKIPGVDFSL